MRLKILVSTLLLLAVMLPLTMPTGASGSSNCIILVEGSAAFLSTYADGLHALLDLLPADLQLGLLVTGEATNLQLPTALSRTWRAELHAFLERAYPATDALPESDWEAMLRSSISLLASRASAKNTIIVLRADASLPETWPELTQTAAEWGILLYDVDLSAPQVRETVIREHRRPGQLANGGLARLPELLGLATAELTSLAYGDTGMQLGVMVPAGVQSLILQWDRVAMHQVLLTTPTGELVDPLVEAFQTQLFAGPSYSCLHLTPTVLPTLTDWQGQWKITASGSIGIGVWYTDPAWLQASVRETKGQRVLSLATRLGEMLPHQRLQVTVTLLDWRGKPLVQLNDLGINGDGVAGDGIYGAVLPSFVSAGPAKIQVSGGSERSLTVILPAASPAIATAVTAEAGLTSKLLIVGLGLTVSGFGMIHGKRSRPAVWRISHQGIDGYWHHYDLNTNLVLAGSGVSSQIRLARSTAVQQLRLRLAKDDALKLDILAREPITCVNDVQIYVGKQLEHGDRIRIAGETLLVERLANLRAGKHAG